MNVGDKVSWIERVPVTTFEDRTMTGKVTFVKPDGTIVVKPDRTCPGHILFQPEEITRCEDQQEDGSAEAAVRHDQQA